MLAVFGQGQDVVRTLQFDLNDPERTRHTAIVCVLLFFWGWSNWRSTRLITHLKAFDFSEFYRSYAIRTLVIMPRLFAMLPFAILSYATYISHNGISGMILIYIALAAIIYTLLVFRRKFMVLLKTKNFWFSFLIDYIPVKSEAYPISFILSKQKWWINFRIFFIGIIFLLVFLFPLSFSRFIGSAGLVIAATIAWMTLFTHLMLLELRYKFPLVFLLFVFWFVFSFFNNNHEIRTTKKIENDKRLNLDEYVTGWLKYRYKRDTIPVYLIASEGGGARAALWTYETLKEMSIKIPGFKENILAYSSVSGGSLGTVTYQLLKNDIENTEIQKKAYQFLINDFLSPIMAYAMFPDALQRFLPFPVREFDRAAILEKTWENDWEKTFGNNKFNFKSSLLDYSLSLSQKHDALIFMNSTHIETGKRIIISPVKLNDENFYETTDLLNVMGKDISLSTATVLSARFPYLTPAGLIYDSNNKKWGQAGDGGYYENLGISTILDVYSRLRIVSEKMKIPVKVNIIFIRNNKDYSETTPLNGMYEFLSPIKGYLNVWYKSGTYNMNLIKNTSLKKCDKIYNIILPRFKHDIIPLGWSLSVYATKYIKESAGKVVEKEMIVK